jgi:hypothetical protein
VNKKIPPILAVGLLAAVLTGFCISIFCGSPGIDKNVKTEAILDGLKLALEGFRIKNGAWPSTSNAILLQELIDSGFLRNDFRVLPGYRFNGEREILDAWGVPIRFGVKTEMAFSIQSAGRDKKYDTDDDIIKTLSINISTPASPLP